MVNTVIHSQTWCSVSRTAKRHSPTIQPQIRFLSNFSDCRRKEYRSARFGNSATVYVGSPLQTRQSRSQICRTGNTHTVMVGEADDSYLAVFVNVHVKKGYEEQFLAASVQNAKNSVQEDGIARFDVIQQVDNPSKFVLVEVYKTAEAPAAHKETQHYNLWRETVAPWMQEPRQATKYWTRFPSVGPGWQVPDNLGSGSTTLDAGNARELLAVHVFVSCKEGTEAAFKAASLENACNSLQEPGVARFDVLQHQEDKSKFMLVEVYCTESAPADHKETRHYSVWRDTVADMMADPRTAIKYVNVFPQSEAGWRQP